MKTPVWKLLLVLGLLNPASAALVDFNFQYERVELKTGRKLENVTFKTYDTVTGRVGAATGRALLSVRLGDLPDEVAARIKARAPVQTEDEIKAEQERAAEERVEAKQRARELETRARDEAMADRAARRALDVKRAETAMEQEAKNVATVAAAAKAMASHYFTYEADPHSSVGFVFDSNILLEEPEPVPGWTNRWRVRGKVGVQYLTRNAGAVGRNTKEFELLIEAPPQGKAKLVDVTVSRM